MNSGISKDGILNIVPPNSIDAEKALLSAILIDNSQANSVLGIINPEDFYDSVNAKIFRIISKLSEKNEPIDIITILHR
jgi:Replicative DNA helicase